MLRCWAAFLTLLVRIGLAAAGLFALLGLMLQLVALRVVRLMEKIMPYHTVIHTIRNPPPPADCRVRSGRGPARRRQRLNAALLAATVLEGIEKALAEAEGSTQPYMQRGAAENPGSGAES